MEGYNRVGYTVHDIKYHVYITKCTCKIFTNAISVRL